jgi:hypothetical protein
MVAVLAAHARRRGDLRLVLDTGDIVDDGRHRDQFAMLARILEPLRAWPYLVAIGNHEVADGRPGFARLSTAQFLQSGEPLLTEERLYYEKRIGPLRLIFLDSNDLVYTQEEGAARRARAQIAWLSERLAEPETGPHGRTILLLHHPFLQSSKMHLAHARAVWSLEIDGLGFADRLVEGGVDLVLAGHTHTFERFVLRRADGRELQLVNFSGRPREAIFWFGAEDRRARDIRGRETAWLEERGFTGTERWSIRQEDPMIADEANQFGLFTVHPDGGLDLEVHFLSPDGEELRLLRRTIWTGDAASAPRTGER